MEEKTTTPRQTFNFFNFEFDVLEWNLIWCRMDGSVIDLSIWNSLWNIKQKYDKKNTTLKLRTKTFENKQKYYCEQLEIWKKNKEHLCEHISKAEQKLSEYKNVILAFGKLATTSAISK